MFLHENQNNGVEIKILFNIANQTNYNIIQNNVQLNVFFLWKSFSLNKQWNEYHLHI